MQGGLRSGPLALWAQKRLQTDLSLTRRGATHRRAIIAWVDYVHCCQASLGGVVGLRPPAQWPVAGCVRWAQ